MPRSLPRPLLLTHDPQLLDDLLALTAAVGVEPLVCGTVDAARPAWSDVGLIVIGWDLASAAARADLPRRDGLVLVGSDPDNQAVWRLAVSLGAEHVVFLPDGDTWLTGRIAQASEPSGERAPLVCVLGGCGGAGASTLAAGLALAAAAVGNQVLLVDADRLGGGIDMLLGAEDAIGPRWPDLTGLRGRVAGAELRAALPSGGGVSVLSHDRRAVGAVPGAAMQAVLDAGRGDHDVLVVDLPRVLDEAALHALKSADRCLLVVPAQVRAAAAAAALLGELPGSVRRAGRLGVVVRGPGPAGLDPAQVAHALALPLWGAYRSEPALAAAVELGDPLPVRGRGSLATLCRTLLSELGQVAA